MKPPPASILVFHTAFPGDVILMTPMLSALRERIPGARIAVVATPLASGLLEHHPAVDELISYDKRGRERGIRKARSLAMALRRRRFDIALVPHRSFRSAAVVRAARIPRRVGFATSAGRLLFTDRVHDDRTAHEIRRNLALLEPLGIVVPGTPRPSLHPSAEDRLAVERFLGRHPGVRRNSMVGIAPGSVWNTKRWPAEKFADLCRRLLGGGFSPVLVGGREDATLCLAILEAAGGGEQGTVSAGHLTLLQSAALLAACRVTVSNDSAPMHLSVAVGTPVVAIFGPTVPAFGFPPVGPQDVVVGTDGLPCRPCSIHGGHVCPIATFDCMKRVDAGVVAGHVVHLAENPGGKP